MRYVVTGAAGFIGANIVKALNDRGESDIIAVDDLTQSDKFVNLVDCEIEDFIDKDIFLDSLREGNFGGTLRAVFHQGACSDTMETNGRFMMNSNYHYSSVLLDYCQYEEIPFIYASSAAVYGCGPKFTEERQCEAPLNIYGYSKFLFDQLVRRKSSDLSSQFVGLRYFNVYGAREQHKNRMASVAFHFFNQYRANGKVKLFEGSGDYSAGEQLRDFISVEDVVKVNLFFLDKPERSGIFNVGTGAAQSFNQVAVATINSIRESKGEALLTLAELQARGTIEYIPFPDGLKERYQSFTQADLANLRDIGYEAPFLNVEHGVARYVGQLLKQNTR